MISAITGVRSVLRKTVDTFIPFPNPTCYQCLRWRRKPRWLPVAPSKKFRVPERKRYPEDENIEVMRLNNKYRTEMKSLRVYFFEKTKSMTTAPEVIEQQLKKEEDHHAKCIEENNRWNAEVAELRKARLLKLENERREEIMNKLVEHENMEKEIFRKSEALVRQEKENSKYFITESNIDEAIEKALANKVDYNFAIDIEGNITAGRKTKPIKPEPKTEVKAQAVN